MVKDDNAKVLAEIKRIAEQGSPLAEQPPKAPDKSIPRASPKESEGDEVVIAKEDFDALLSMAKKQDIQETLGQQIEAEKTMQPQTMQPREETIQVQPQPNLGIASMDYGGLLNRPTVLYFDTDRTCQLIQPKVNEDGSVIVGDRTFDFTKGQPSILNMGKFGKKQSHPFYIIKYSSMRPIDVAEEYPETNPTPEQASRLVELGTLETLSKIPGGKVKRKMLILLMVMSMVMGGVAVYAMSMFGVI